MKLLILIVLFTNLAYSAEVKTDCISMNEGREKIIKPETGKKTTPKGSSRQ